MTAGYEPRFDIDRTYGEGGEASLREALALADEAFEVKRKRRIDDTFYVELEQSPRATGVYKPSGINTTGASYWAYEVGESGLFVLTPTDILRGAVRTSRVRARERDGDNPTRGRLVRFGDLLIAIKRGVESATAGSPPPPPVIDEIAERTLIDLIADETITGPAVT